MADAILKIELTGFTGLTDEQLRMTCLEFASRNPNSIALDVAKEMYAWVKEKSEADA
jgi:hypothetical protein